MVTNPRAWHLLHQLICTLVIIAALTVLPILWWESQTFKAEEKLFKSPEHGSVNTLTPLTGPTVMFFTEVKL